MIRPPRYPGVKVRSRSSNPFLMIALVRYALRSARISSAEIDRFSEEALEPRSSDRDTEELCREWVDWARS